MKQSELKQLIKEEILFLIEKTQKMGSWDGKLENVDRILTDNYELMKQVDKNLKDNILNKFNDGDIPFFSAKTLSKIGASKEAQDILPLLRQRYGRYVRIYDELDDREYLALEDSVRSLIKYFIKKYPDFFKKESRQKTISNWKREIMKYSLNDNSNLKPYWVSSFGSEFGVKELLKYNPYGDKPYEKKEITNPDEVARIIKIMKKNI